MYKEMHPDIHREAITRLEFDFKFKLPKSSGKYLRGGLCPQCHQKELWAYYNAPWTIMCGRTNNCNYEFHLRDQYPDLFENWEKRFQPTQQNPNATVDAYLSEGRGFPLDKLKGLYSQEYYKKNNDGSVTIRFPINDDPDHPGWWQRLLDPKGTLSKTKTTFKFDFDATGHAWIPPNVNLVGSKEIWITEGIFDTIAFWLSDIVSISQLSAHNYPGIILAKIAHECDQKGITRPKLIFALDNDDSGHRGIYKNIERAKQDGWECSAAQPPYSRRKLDWNDLYKQDRLKLTDLENYRYYGELLIAARPMDKAVLIHNRNKKKSFSFDHQNKLYWFKMDVDKYESMLKSMGIDENDNEDWLIDEKNSETKKIMEDAAKHSCSVTEIAKCKPKALYYQYAEETDEAWYYFQIDFPKSNLVIKNTFTSTQLSSAPEFKKRLLAIASVNFKGNSAQLDALLDIWIDNIKRVKLTRYIGYHQDLDTYALGDIAIHKGKVYYLNKEDFFELPNNINLKSKSPIEISINPKPEQYKPEWIDDYVTAYKTKGLIVLTAFFSSLFAQQIRKKHKSFPFIEIVGEAGAGKSTLIYFLWKLLGRDKYEGINPTATTDAGLKRTFRQVSNMPVLLIESDKEGESKLRQFNFDSIKTLYDGGSLGASGVKNGGNDTIDTPFMGTIIISQNTPVCGSEAIRGRIVHISYNKSDNTKQTFQASRKLEKYELNDLSGFTIKCLEKEQEILKSYFESYEKNDFNLQKMESIGSTRIIHNHVQFMAMFDALSQHVLSIDEEMQASVYDELLEMAIERDKMLKADSEIVRNFWDVYEQIEASKSLTEDTVLNHARKRHEKIAINFAHLYKVAADLRYQLPELRQLQDELKHSQYYKFIEANASISSAIQNRTIRCWVFQPPNSMES